MLFERPTLAPGDPPMSRGTVPPELLRNTKLPKSVLEKLFGASRVPAPKPHYVQDPTSSATTAFTETMRTMSGSGSSKRDRRPTSRSTSSMNRGTWHDGRDPRLEHEKMRVEAVAKSNLDKLLADGKKSRRAQAGDGSFVVHSLARVCTRSQL